MGKSNKNNNDGCSGAQKILDHCLAMEARTGELDVPRKTIASLCGLKANTFVVTLSVMKNKQGLITYDKESIRLTEKGRAKANPMPLEEPLGDNLSVQEDFKKRFKIGGKAGQVFDAVCDGADHDRPTLASNLGITNKATFAVMLSNLKKNGLIQYDKTTVRGADVLFPFGRTN